MTFNSYIFILAFFPAFVILYYMLGKINGFVGKALIIVGSVVFYVYAGWDVAAVLGISIVINFTLALVMSKKRGKRPVLAFAIIVNVLLLLYFKYLNFAIDIINDIGNGNIKSKDILLPLGISFFTFQQIMYVVAVWKGEIGKISVTDYLAYILYFPKLVMGPLMEPDNFFKQLNDEKRTKVNWDNLASGLKIFSLGLFKKVLLADTFAKAVSWGFANGISTSESVAKATSGDLFLVMLFYTFQIYFDFSGYSDMAVGVSKMLNINLPMNFDSPYKATSIRDFWKRWHMSLTSFLTKYIYFPLGGSRKGKVRTYVNIMIVFLVSGIWHGANFTFILWGAIHGLLQIIERLLGKAFDALSETVRWFCTFLSVNLLWLLFRCESIADWGEMLSTMFRFKNMSISSGLIKCFSLPENGALFDILHLNHINSLVRGFGMVIFILAAYIICLVPENNYKKMDKTNGFTLAVCMIAFVWGFLCLSSESVFVYFNF